MDKKENEVEFKEMEQVYTIPISDKQEIRFSVVEFDGKKLADIRYFAEFGDVKGLRATKRAITVGQARLSLVREGVKKLSERLAKK